MTTPTFELSALRHVLAGVGADNSTGGIELSAPGLVLAWLSADNLQGRA